MANLAAHIVFVLQVIRIFSTDFMTVFASRRFSNAVAIGRASAGKVYFIRIVACCTLHSPVVVCIGWDAFMQSAEFFTNSTAMARSAIEGHAWLFNKDVSGIKASANRIRAADMTLSA